MALAAAAPARVAPGLAPARARPLAAPCRFVGGSNGRGGGSPSPQHPTTTLDEALARLTNARLAASEAVERLARMANDPDEAVAELVSKLTGVAYGGVACAAAARRQRQQRMRSRRNSSSSSSSLLPPIVVVFDALDKQRRHNKAAAAAMAAEDREASEAARK
jgi:hypothetical protein